MKKNAESWGRRPEPLVPVAAHCRSTSGSTLRSENPLGFAQRHLACRSAQSSERQVVRLRKCPLSIDVSACRSLESKGEARLYLGAGAGTRCTSKLVLGELRGSQCSLAFQYHVLQGEFCFDDSLMNFKSEHQLFVSRPKHQSFLFSASGYGRRLIGTYHQSIFGFPILGSSLRRCDLLGS